MTEADFKTAESEEELRRRAALPDFPLKYLRFSRSGDGVWTLAARAFDGWPKSLSELKILDPCCGSGHFMVSAFLMLVPMRMALEKLSAQEAVNRVISENIHGLEIDQRCVELAAFALALTAWLYPDAGGYRTMPELNVACSGLSIRAKKEEWIALAGDSTNLQLALEELYNQFRDAPMLGSLINPETGLSKGLLFELKWEILGPLLSKALSGEKDYERSELGVVAQGVARAAAILVDKYHLVITNVPYLGMKRMSSNLYGYCNTFFSKSKADLATVFLKRWIGSSRPITNISFVLPQNWLFLGSYKGLREYLLGRCSINILALLGSGAFDTVSGEVVKAILLNLTTAKAREDHVSYGLDVSNEISIEHKASNLVIRQLSSAKQEEIKRNPDHRLIISQPSDTPLLEEKAISRQGIINGDYAKWLRKHWEVQNFHLNNWARLQSSINKTGHYFGRDSIIDWRNNGKEMPRPRLDNPTYGKKGVAISRMGNLSATIYTGELYDQNVAVLAPYDGSDLLALLCYAESPSFNEEVRKLDKKVGVTSATFLQIPFDLDHWAKVAQGKYPNGLPKPYSNDPTQWIFHGHPVPSDEPLQVAVARLLGYCWPAELDNNMELSGEARAWVKKSKDLLFLADNDGIVCIPPVRGEASAADRLLNLLAAAYKDNWSINKLAQLLKKADHAGKTLETWLRDKFFSQHCKLFHHWPFIWHIWDGLRDGFGALINYHMLDAKLLESLIYVYLGDWISRQKQDKANGVDGAEDKLVAAEALKKSLELILEGEAPYDIFVRWKPIERQPVGWAPDLNDGVRLNIRPFLTIPDVWRKGAGVMRDKPNINWNKDRGKDVKSAPWYYLGLQYGGREGDRINDHHLSLAEKRAAREVKKMETR